jgi:hypothetical protein
MTAFLSLRPPCVAATPSTNATAPAGPAQLPGQRSGEGVASIWHELELDTLRAPSTLQMPTTRMLRGRGGETAPLRKNRQEPQ